MGKWLVGLEFEVEKMLRVYVYRYRVHRYSVHTTVLVDFGSEKETYY